jgi:hypothetical protein
MISFTFASFITRHQSAPRIIAIPPSSWTASGNLRLWLIANDFSLIRSAADKSSGHVNSRLCDAFNDTIESLGLWKFLS